MLRRVVWIGVSGVPGGECKACVAEVALLMS